MSNADDVSSRLSHALDEVFSRGTSQPTPGDDEPVADWSVDDDEPTLDDTGEVEVGALGLPQIVPATADRPSTAPDVVVPPSLPVARRAPVARTAPPVTPIPHQPTPADATRTVAAPTPTAAPSPPATAWGDHMTGGPIGPQAAGLRAPGRRPRVRRVTRVLRHIDPWSTFKVALLFSAVAYVVMLTSGVLLWRVAESTGTLDNVERWFTQFGWETFELKGGEIFHNAWIIGLFGAVALTGAFVLMATLFNLVSDIVGGVRLTVLEEEVVERTVSSTRRYVVRRPPVAGDPLGGSATDWDVDGDDEPGVAVAGTQSSLTSSDSNPISAPTSDWSVDDD
jgi:hypothetical protein